jgi:hypothetical protein
VTLPDVDDLSALGGALNDASPVVDPTTDMPAAAGNVAMADIAAATHTATRAWTRFTLSPGAVASATPVLVSHDSNWGSSPGVAPTFTRTSAGLYTVTWPATVVDQIPNGAPGFVSSHTLNIRSAWAGVQTGTVAFVTLAQPTSANIVTLRVFNPTTGAAADPAAATDVTVFWV